MRDDANQSDIDSHIVVVFDAECVLCSTNAQFILQHDHHHRFLLASMQGEFGSRLYQTHGIDPSNPETLIVKENTNLYRNSDAILVIYQNLGWPWRVVSILKFVPRLIRDPIYLMIARNRYKLFGKRKTCWLPSAKYQDRVI